MKRPGGHRERGMALLFVLVILMMLAWFGLSGMRLTGQHLQIVGNSQARTQATAAAQRAIEQTISSNQFALDPRAVAAAPIETDVDGDGHNDFRAVLDPVPRCARVRPIKTSELDVALARDRVCLLSSDAGGTQRIEQPDTPVATGDSLCAASEWDIVARVDDRRSGAVVAVQQGVGIRVGKYEASNYCR
jgi:hypothetical protein